MKKLERKNVCAFLERKLTDPRLVFGGKDIDKIEIPTGPPGEDGED